MAVDRNGLVILDREACLKRLGRTGIGRVALSVAARPEIFPVNYAMWGDDIVFRTTAGTKLAAGVSHAVVAFEIDQLDRMAHAGWSVLVTGPCREITDPAELAVTDRLPLARWARGGGSEFTMCIRSEMVTGRSLVNATLDSTATRIDKEVTCDPGRPGPSE
jgi:hypothetical protein